MHSASIQQQVAPDNELQAAVVPLASQPQQYRVLQSLHKPGTQDALFLTFAFAFLYLRTFMLPGTPLVPRGDQVLFFEHANRILLGQAPFRDYFAFVMPGADLLYAGAFRLLGVHAWVAQAFVIVLGVSIAYLILWISRAFWGTPTAFLPALLFLALDFDSAPDATHHWYSTLLVTAAGGILLRGQARWRLLLAGSLCGLATLFTQTRGVLGLAAIAVFIVWTAGNRRHCRETWTRLALLLTPFFLIVAGFVGYYAHQAGLKTLYYALAYFAFKYVPTFPAYTLKAYVAQLPRHSSWHDAVDIGRFLFIYALVPFAYLFGMVRLVHRRNNVGAREWNNMLLINLIGIALFCAVIPGPTYHRLCMAAPPAIVVFVWLFGGTARFDRSVRTVLWSIAGVLLLYLPVHRQLQRRSYLDLPIGRTAFIDPIAYEQNKWVAEQSHPGDSFFSEPQISFALRLRNPTPMDYVTPYQFTRPEQVRAVVQGLTDFHTPLVFLPNFCIQPQPNDNLQPLRQYLQANYHIANTYASGQVWQRD